MTDMNTMYVRMNAPLLFVLIYFFTQPMTCEWHFLEMTHNFFLSNKQNIHKQCANRHFFLIRIFSIDFHLTFQMTPLYVTLVIYLSISFPLFYLVFNSSQTVVDEEFHLRQGRHYCMGNFHIVSIIYFFFILHYTSTIK